MEFLIPLPFALLLALTYVLGVFSGILVMAWRANK